MKKKMFVFLTFTVILVFSIVQATISANEKGSAILLENIEALTKNPEDAASPCNTSGGICLAGMHPIPGIHFAND